MILNRSIQHQNIYPVNILSLKGSVLKNLALYLFIRNDSMKLPGKLLIHRLPESKFCDFYGC